MPERPKTIAGWFIATVSLFAAACVFALLGRLESRVVASPSVTLMVAGTLLVAALACAAWTAWRIVAALDFLVAAVPEGSLASGPLPRRGADGAGTQVGGLRGMPGP